MIKTCTLCQGEKPLSAFNLDRTAKDGHDTRCKPCDRATYRASRLASLDHARELERARAARYRAAHPDRRRATLRQYSRRARLVSRVAV